MTTKTHAATALLLGTVLAGKFIEYRYGQSLADTSTLSVFLQGGAIALATFAGGILPDLDYTGADGESSLCGIYKDERTWSDKLLSLVDRWYYPERIITAGQKIAEPPGIDYMGWDPAWQATRKKHEVEKTELDTRGDLSPATLLRNWNAFFDHRMELHTIVNAIGCAMPFMLVYMLLSIFHVNAAWLLGMGIAVGAGVIWHMIADTFTKSGIMWLFPLSRKRFKIPFVAANIKPGDSEEVKKIKVNRMHKKELFFYIAVSLLLLFCASDIWSDIINMLR